MSKSITRQYFTPRHQYGLSLIELMISIVLGLLLTTAAVQVLLSSKQTFRFEKESSNIQENARFAIEMMSREIALAGFTSCRSNALLANVVNGSGVAANWQLGSPGIQGFDNLQATAAFPLEYRADRLANTDSIIVRGAAGNALFTVASYAQPVFQFVAGTNVSESIKNGDLVLAANTSCQNVSVFQVSNVTATSVTYATAGTPGNCSLLLGSSVQASSCTSGTFAGAAFATGSSLMPYRVSAFYIAPSTFDANVPALWRARLMSVGGATQVRREELVQGVENLQIRYGYDTNNDNVPNYFLAANDAALIGGVWDWGKVVSVRIALLLRGLQPTESADRVNADFEGIGVPTDRYARQRVTTTLQLKNHGLK